MNKIFIDQIKNYNRIIIILIVLIIVPNTK